MSFFMLWVAMVDGAESLVGSRSDGQDMDRVAQADGFEAIASLELSDQNEAIIELPGG